MVSKWGNEIKPCCIHLGKQNAIKQKNIHCDVLHWICNNVTQRRIYFSVTRSFWHFLPWNTRMNVWLQKRYEKRDFYAHCFILILYNVPEICTGKGIAENHYSILFWPLMHFSHWKILPFFFQLIDMFSLIQICLKY